MALQGTLQDFPIADIFQLIGHQRKTGILVLKRDDDEVRVFFHEGKIFRAQPVDRNRPDLLGDTLVRAGLIADTQLEEALATQRKTLQRLGDIFVDRGMLERDTIQRVADLQATETVYQLFHWTTGTYEFEQRTLEIATDMAEPIPADNVLMEGIRRVDEWPMIRKHIPNLDLVFRRTVDLDLPGEGLSKAKKDRHIGKNERLVYGLIDSERTVNDLVDLSLIGEFEVCKALWNLLNAGRVKRAEDDSEEEEESEPLRDALPGLLLRGLIGALFTLVVLGVIAAAAFASLQVMGKGPVVEMRKREIDDRIQQRLIATVQRARLTRVLEAHAFQRGAYPEQLDELLVDSSIEMTDLSYPWTEPYFYERAGSGFILLDPRR